jgi:hypothetical protein
MVLTAYFVIFPVREFVLPPSLTNMADPNPVGLKKPPPA